ncbi:hypothetical protein GGF32_001734 [Allomyces javanicus]|nr:hypothetical protein GGF32_006945 [Allomyces javanicus]KAJ3355993.1 hypothetical protein GGF32_001734 [Allomyces javanicus]
MSNPQPHAPTRANDDLVVLYADPRLAAFWTAYENPYPHIRKAHALAKSNLLRKRHFAAWEARARALLQLAGVWTVVAVDRLLLSSPAAAKFDLEHHRESMASDELKILHGLINETTPFPEALISAQTWLAAILIVACMGLSRLPDSFIKQRIELINCHELWNYAREQVGHAAAAHYARVADQRDLYTSAMLGGLYTPPTASAGQPEDPVANLDAFHDAFNKKIRNVRIAAMDERTLCHRYLRLLPIRELTPFARRELSRHSNAVVKLADLQERALMDVKNPGAGAAAGPPDSDSAKPTLEAELVSTAPPSDVLPALANRWILDPAEHLHMTFDSNDFIEYEPVVPVTIQLTVRYHERESIVMPSTIIGRGTVLLNSDKPGGRVRLNNVVHVPEVVYRRISLRRLLKLGYAYCLAKDDVGVYYPPLPSLGHEHEAQVVLAGEWVEGWPCAKVVEGTSTTSSLARK